MKSVFERFEFYCNETLKMVRNQYKDYDYVPDGILKLSALSKSIDEFQDKDKFNLDDLEKIKNMFIEYINNAKNDYKPYKVNYKKLLKKLFQNHPPLLWILLVISIGCCGYLIFAGPIMFKLWGIYFFIKDIYRICKFASLEYKPFKEEKNLYNKLSEVIVDGESKKDEIALLIEKTKSSFVLDDESKEEAKILNMINTLIENFFQDFSNSQNKGLLINSLFSNINKIDNNYIYLFSDAFYKAIKDVSEKALLVIVNSLDSEVASFITLDGENRIDKIQDDEYLIKEKFLMLKEKTSEDNYIYNLIRLVMTINNRGERRVRQ